MHWYGVRKRIILLEIRKKEIDRYILQELISLLNKLEGSLVATKLKQDLLPKVTNCPALIFPYFFFFGFWIMKQQMSNSTKLLKDLLPKVTEFEATYVAMQWWKDFAKDCLLTGQEQAYTRITWLFGRLFGCHHA